MYKSIGLATAHALSPFFAPSASSAAQLAKAMASACLPVLTYLGDFLDDPELCALACSERMRWDRSALQRQTRKDGQLLVLLLSGRAECRHDWEREAQDCVPFLAARGRTGLFQRRRHFDTGAHLAGLQTNARR